MNYDETLLIHFSLNLGKNNNVLLYDLRTVIDIIFFVEFAAKSICKENLLSVRFTINYCARSVIFVVRHTHVEPLGAILT